MAKYRTRPVVIEAEQGDGLTCATCGTEGSGIGFEHRCSPSFRCSHITAQVRAVSVHSGMQVGARVSPTGDLWWCVGCGGLFADSDGKRAVAIVEK